MRWALVILILYILPIVILFKNKKDFKRSSIYGCIYTVVASVIVISNIYISTLNKMEDILENRKFAIDEKHKKIKTHQKKNVYKQDDNNKIKETINTNAKESENKPTHEYKKRDKEIIRDFKTDIYDIERKALVPMRECIPDMKKLDLSFKSIKTAKQNVAYAKEMCDEVVNIYESMEIPNLSKEEDTEKLKFSKEYIRKAYILRGKAMECAGYMLDSKNLKYISEIKEYLRLSDIEIEKFVNIIKEI